MQKNTKNKAFIYLLLLCLLYVGGQQRVWGQDIDTLPKHIPSAINNDILKCMSAGMVLDTTNATIDIAYLDTLNLSPNDLITTYKPLFGVPNNSEWRIKDKLQDMPDFKSYNQYLNGIRIEMAYFQISIGKDNKLRSNSEVFEWGDFNTMPSIDKQQALSTATDTIAKLCVDNGDCLASLKMYPKTQEPELVIAYKPFPFYPQIGFRKESFVLAYRLELGTYLVYVDANTGKILYYFSTIMHNFCPSPPPPCNITTPNLNKTK